MPTVGLIHFLAVFRWSGGYEQFVEDLNHNDIDEKLLGRGLSEVGEKSIRMPYRIRDSDGFEIETDAGVPVKPGLTARQTTETRRRYFLYIGHPKSGHYRTALSMMRKDRLWMRRRSLPGTRCLTSH